MPAPNQELNILLIEDVAADALLINHELRKAGLNFRCRRVETREELLQELKTPPDIILSDHGLPQFDGFTALKIVKSVCPEVPFIFVTGSIGEESAVETLKSGAADYVLKDHIRNLGPAVNRALRQSEEKRRRREAEQALRESEARHTAILNAALDAIILIDAHGVIHEWNPASERMFEYARSAAIGRRLDDLIMPASVLKLYRDGLSHYLTTGSGSLLGRPVEFSARRADGREFVAELAITRVPDSEPPKFTSVIRDITERKEAEAEVRRLNSALEKRVAERTAQLEAANKDLEAFSYSVSHDLRAPLRHISGFLQILEQHATERLEDEDRQLIEFVTRSVTRMSRLIDDLLAFSRLGLAELHTHRVQLGELVQAVRRDLEPTSKSAAEWVIGDLPEVDADPVLLQQVLVNLIGNALKYSRQAARPRIEIQAETTPREVVVRVKDNGVGFDMQYASRLFNVFQRLHRESEFEGTGIGLANVRRIVQRHGGRTWAESRPGEGATFYFSLPVRSQPPPPSPS